MSRFPELFSGYDDPQDLLPVRDARSNADRCQIPLRFPLTRSKAPDRRVRACRLLHAGQADCRKPDHAPCCKTFLSETCHWTSTGYTQNSMKSNWPETAKWREHSPFDSQIKLTIPVDTSNLQACLVCAQSCSLCKRSVHLIYRCSASFAEHCPITSAPKQCDLCVPICPNAARSSCKTTRAGSYMTTAIPCA